LSPAVVLDRELASLLSMMISAQAQFWQKMRSILELRFQMISLIFQFVRRQTKTKYFRKAEYEL
jgi:hypothetical protein